MKKITAFILTLLIVFNISFPSYAAEKNADKQIRILVVGNSQIYFNSFRKIIEQVGSDYDIDIQNEKICRP